MEMMLGFIHSNMTEAEIWHARLAKHILTLSHILSESVSVLLIFNTANRKCYYVKAVGP